MTFTARFDVTSCKHKSRNQTITAFDMMVNYTIKCNT